MPAVYTLSMAHLCAKCIRKLVVERLIENRLLSFMFLYLLEPQPWGISF